MATATCSRDGTETRLTCVTCATPICPKCMVETKVGFKCPEHGRVTAAPLPRRDPDPQAAKKAGSGSGSGGSRPPRRAGGFRLWPLFLGMLLFPVFGLGLMALFAATADSTGFVALLPLLAVGALLFGGALYFASRVTR